MTYNDHIREISKMWEIFDDLTSETPALADIPMFIIPPFSQGDKDKWFKYFGYKETIPNA